MDPRLSYLHASDNRVPDEVSMRLFNPVLNLTDVFNNINDEGALKVYLRVRPTLPSEVDESSDGDHVDIVDNHTITLTAPSSSNTFKNSSHGITKLNNKFSFSHIYGPGVGQEELYEKTTQSLVDRFMSGQNCLLFTYGATSSGKTYTVQGTSSSQGLLPRSLDTIFSSVQGKSYPRRDLKPQYHCSIYCLNEKETKVEEVKKENLFRDMTDQSILSISAASRASTLSSNSMDDSAEIEGQDKDTFKAPSEGIFYAVFVSFAEIYNEIVYDLLEKLSAGTKKRIPHQLGEDRDGNSYIKGLQNIRVDSSFEALKVLEYGKRNLHFATTRLNHNSSRSHCIFTIKLVQMASPDTPKYARVSMFSICDLAGAERAAKTQGTGERLKEAGNINTSLLVLSRCISALRHNQVSINQSHSSTTEGKRREFPVPYRDSKLTRLLQSFFLGQGVAAMIVNISPNPKLFDETLQVLKFSAIAKKVITCTEPGAAPVQKAVRTSQFNKMIRCSLNKRYSKVSDNSGRLSVPWMNNSVNTTANVTFGEDKEDTSLCVVEEEDEEEDDNEVLQMCMAQIQKLTDALKKVNNEKKDLEMTLRTSLCTEFKKQLVEVENRWRSRMENEQSRTNELHNWRIEKLSEYYNETMKPKKRPRNDETDQFDDSLVMFANSNKVEELEEKVRVLEETSKAKDEELSSLYTTLKKTNSISSRMQEDNTKLQFQLATLTKNFDDVKTQMASLSEENKKLQMAPVSEVKEEPSSDEAEVESLKSQLKVLQSKSEDLTAELTDNRELLIEAAEAYSNKEDEVEALSVQLQESKGRLTELQLQIDHLVTECVAAQQASSESETQLVEKEKILESVEKELQDLKEKSGVKKENGEEGINEEMQNEISDLRVENDKLQREITGLKEDSKLEQSKLIIVSLEEKVSNLEKAISNEKDRLAAMVNSHEVYKVEKSKLLMDVVELKARLKEVEEREQEMEMENKDKVQNVELKVHNVEKEMEEKVQSLEKELEEKVHTRDLEVTQLSQKVQELTDEKVLLISDKDKAVILNVELESRIEELLAKKESEEMRVAHESALETLRLKLATVEAERDSIVTETNEAISAVEEHVKELIKSKDVLTEELTASQALVKELREEPQKEERVLQLEEELMRKDLDNKALTDKLLEMKQQMDDVTEILNEKNKMDQSAVGILVQENEEQKGVIKEMEKRVQQLEDQMKSVEKENLERINKLKAELKRSKETYQILSKESTAMREARAVEVEETNSLKGQIVSLQSTIQSHEDEIKALEKEMKNNIKIVSEKEEEIRCEELEQKLKAKDEEILSLLSRLSIQAPSTTINLTSSEDESYHLNPPPKRSSAETVSSDEESEEEDKFNEKPSKPPRGVKTTSQTPANEKNVSSQRRPLRKTRGCVPVLNEEGTPIQAAADSSDEWEAPPPSTNRRSKRVASSVKKPPTTTSCRSKRNTSSRLFNPHLENMENNSSVANVDVSSITTTTSVNKKGRKKLMDIDCLAEPLICSPVDAPPLLDSPHTNVKRKLRGTRTNK